MLIRITIFEENNIMLTRITIIEEKTYSKPMDFDDFGIVFSSDHFSKRYKIQCFGKKNVNNHQIL